jgi:streptomycin 6-kinase
VDGISEHFPTYIIEYYGSVGRRWLSHLDGKVATYCSRWKLKPTGERALTGGRALIVPCRAADGQDVVLKLCPDPYALGRERDGLRHWRASGHTVKVLHGSGSRGAMVLERLHGGSPTRLDAQTLKDVAQLFAAIHETPKPLPALDCEQHVAFLLSHCIGRLSHPDVGAHATTDDFKLALDRALGLAVEHDPARDIMLHGDLHLENLLRGDDGRLVAIDPKPCMGERELDLALLARDAGPIEELESRITSLADVCAADAERVRAWTKVLLLETAINHARWAKSSEQSISAMMEFFRAS